MKCGVRSICRENFERFGYVLEFPEDASEPFCIIAREESQPWRLAVFRFRNKTVKMLERHPLSMESFEPLKGITLLVVAEYDCPGSYEAFVLDKPVCLYKGVWHQVLALTDEAQVKIAENLDVESEFYELEKEAGVALQEFV